MLELENVVQVKTISPRGEQYRYDTDIRCIFEKIQAGSRVAFLC